MASDDKKQLIWQWLQGQERVNLILSSDASSHSDIGEGGRD